MMSMIIGAAQQKRSHHPLYMKWRTTAPNESITLPLNDAAGLNYNFIVDWGDGSTGQVTSYADTDKTHQYAVAGDYVARINGTCEGLGTWTGGMAVKLIEVYGGAGMVFKNLLGAFVSCTNLTKTLIPDWDVSLVTVFGYNWTNGIFVGCSKLVTVDMENWQFPTSGTFNFYYFFTGCAKLQTIGNVSKWNVSHCNNFNSMFNSCYELTSLNCDNWDVSLATNFGAMFYQCAKLTSLNLNSWSLNTVSNFTMSGMFAGCTLLTTVGTDLSGWAMTKCTNVQNMFAWCTHLLYFYGNNWTLTGVANLDGIFTEDIAMVTFTGNNWDLRNATSISNLFAALSGLKNVYMQNWNLSSCTNFGLGYTSTVFYACSSLETGDVTGWILNTTTGYHFQYLAYGAAKLTTLTGTNTWNVSKCTSFQFMFYNCYLLDGLDISSWLPTNAISFASMFLYCAKLSSLNLNSWQFNSTSNFTLSSMFMGCYVLTTIGTDLSGWNMAKCNNIEGMFYNCAKLAYFYGNNWNLSGVTTINSIFYGCNSLVTFTGNGWDLRNVTTLSTLFSSRTALKNVYAQNWNLSSCVDLGVGYTAAIFYACTALETVDATGWTLNTASNWTMAYAFYGANKINTISGIASWNMSKCTNMYWAFYGCVLLNGVDTSGWDTSGLTNCGSAFYKCQALTNSFPDTKWWNRVPGIGTYAGCFVNDTLIANYADIPAGWK
jgi:surface protein